jgi:hypothetical protein
MSSYSLKMTKRTFTMLLSKYGLKHDVEALYERGVCDVNDVVWMRPWDVDWLTLRGPFPDYKHTRYRCNATWAQYCFMYKQETGKDHEYA